MSVILTKANESIFNGNQTTDILSLTTIQDLMTEFANVTAAGEHCRQKYDSAWFFDQTRVVNIFTTVLVIVVGLVGNVLAVIVFAQKRFRLKSPGVFLLCLAISDGLFLLTHFFEDTLRTFIDVYVDKQQKTITFDPNCPIFGGQRNKTITDSNNLLKILNITDNYDLTCRFVNYLRYFLRFVSAYIITIFTIQRAIVIFFPLYQSKFASTSYAWRVVLALSSFAGILCIFVPFVFRLNTNESHSKYYCDVNKSNPFIYKFYFGVTIAYIVLIMFIPIITIILCNTLITFQLCRLSKERKIMCNIPSKTTTTTTTATKQSAKSSFPNDDSASRRKSFDITAPMIRTSKKSIDVKIKDDSYKVTRMLIIMSLSYAILNLPYFFAWCIFYYKIAINESMTYTSLNYLFGSLNIAEIFYVLNYGIHFFLYCASGKQFREQLKATVFSNCKFMRGWR
jgi:hypothetical protein